MIFTATRKSFSQLKAFCLWMYHLTLSWAEHRYAPALLFFVAFIQAIFFPIPPDVLLIAMVLAKPKRGLLYALICTLGSVAGGLGSYALGYYAFDFIALPVLDGLCPHIPKYCPQSFVPGIQEGFNAWGAWLVGFASLSIFPYKLITLTAGMVEMSLVTFTLTSFIGRGLRFFVIAILLHLYGVEVKNWIETHMTWVMTICCLLAGAIIYLMIV